MVHKLRLAEPCRLSTKILRVRHMQVLMRLAAIRDPLLPAGQVATFVRVYFRIAICATQRHVLSQSRSCLLLRNNRKNKGYSSYWPSKLHLPGLSAPSIALFLSLTVLISCSWSCVVHVLH